MTNNFAKNVEQIKPAVVMILAETSLSEIPFTGGEYITMSNKIFSKGTGFIVTEDGFILTANHVVKEAKDKIQVRIVRDNKLYETEAELISANIDADVALLKIDGRNFPYIELGEYNKFKEGMSIGFIGFPLRMNLPMTNNGIISRISKFQHREGGENVDIYNLNAFINPGNSGGPVFSTDTGEVIAIINARMKVVDEDQFIKYDGSGVKISGIDPIALSVKVYNDNLKFIGDVTQVGIGFSISIEYGKELLRAAR